MITELVIDRAKWGKGSLHNTDCTKCCLGHLSTACGVPDSEMPADGKMGYPREAWVKKYGVPEQLAWTRQISLSNTNQAAVINDNTDPDEIKEPKLIRLFREHGIALSFVGARGK